MRARAINECAYATVNEPFVILKRVHPQMECFIAPLSAAGRLLEYNWDRSNNHPNHKMMG